MKLFYKIKRDGSGLWVKMYSNCKGNYYAVSRPIKTRIEAKVAFAEFAEEIRNGC